MKPLLERLGKGHGKKKGRRIYMGRGGETHEENNRAAGEGEKGERERWYGDVSQGKKGSASGPRGERRILILSQGRVVQVNRELQWGKTEAPGGRMDRIL